MLPDDDLDGDLGTLDVVSMDEIRAAFTGLDGLVANAGLPNLADPQVLKIRFSDGILDGGRSIRCHVVPEGLLQLSLYRLG